MYLSDRLNKRFYLGTQLAFVPLGGFYREICVGHNETKVFNRKLWTLDLPLGLVLG